MSIRDSLANNRVKVGAILLIASWVAPFAPTAIQMAIVLLALVIVSVIVARAFSNDANDIEDYPRGTGDKLLQGAAGATLVAAAWYRFVLGGNGQVVLTIMLVSAIFLVPKPRKLIEGGETI